VLQPVHFTCLTPALPVNKLCIKNGTFKASTLNHPPCPHATTGSLVIDAHLDGIDLELIG
jgi:hypothetical protein